MGSKLRRLRGERSMSLSELSRQSGIGKGTISELENHRRGARLDTLFALTTALGAPLGVLLSDGAAAETELVAGASVSAVLLNLDPPTSCGRAGPARAARSDGSIAGLSSGRRIPVVH